MDDGDPSKSNSTDNQGKPIPETPRTAEGVAPQQMILNASGITENKETEARVKAKDTNNGITSGEKDILDRIKTGERWMILFTAIVAFTTVAQFIQSGCNNRSTSKQVDKIIGAANIQADAATKNAAAAASFATSADGINAKTQVAVDEFDRIAKASENSIRTIQKTAKDALDASIEASQLDQRPWVYISRFDLTSEPEENKEVTVTIGTANSGKTPALDLIPISQLFNWPNEPPPPDFAAIEASGDFPSRGTLPPGASDGSFRAEGLRLDAQGVADYRNRKRAIYIRAKIKYKDVFGNEYWTNLCAFHPYGMAKTLFAFCEHGNDVGPNKPKKH